MQVNNCQMIALNALDDPYMVVGMITSNVAWWIFPVIGSLPLLQLEIIVGVDH